MAKMKLLSLFLSLLLSAPVSVISTSVTQTPPAQFTRLIALDGGSFDPVGLGSRAFFVFGSLSNPGVNVTTTSLQPSTPGSVDYSAFLFSPSMAVDREEKKVYVQLSYYQDGDRNGIFSFSYDGKNKTKILDWTSNFYGGISVARWKGKKSIFYVDGYKNIARANLDGSEIETLVIIEEGDLNQIAIDESMGFIYWSTLYPSGIMRAPLEKKRNESISNRTDIETLSVNASTPNSLRFDNGNLYWTNDVWYGDGDSKNEYFKSRIWEWKANYSNSGSRDIEQEKKIRFEVECLRKWGSWRSIAFDHDRRKVWAIQSFGAYIYSLDMNGGNATRYDLTQSVHDIRAIELI